MKNWEKEFDKGVSVKSGLYNACVDVDQIKQFIQNLLDEKDGKIKRKDNLLNKYAEVISMVYNGEEVSEAEKSVGLVKR